MVFTLLLRTTTIITVLIWNISFITLNIKASPLCSIHDMEELQSLERTPRINTSVGRLCDQPSAGHQLLPQPVSGSDSDLDIQI